MSGASLEVGPFSLDIEEEWTEWLTIGGYNWRNFTFIEAAFEDENHLGSAEIRLALMGLTMRLSWVYNHEAPGRLILKERLADIKAHPEAMQELREIIEEHDERGDEHDTSDR